MSFRGPFPHHCACGNTALFKKMSQRWQAVGSTVSDSTLDIARILDWGGAKPEITSVTTKKKESSQFDLGFVMGGGRNLVGDQFWIGGIQTSSYWVGTKLKKQLNWRSARAEKPILSRKLGEDQKKKVFTVCGQAANQTRNGDWIPPAILATNFSLFARQLGGAGLPGPPWLCLWIRLARNLNLRPPAL